MRFASFKVTNYKSFSSSGQMLLEPGFNVVVGRNNVGKTSLADAMGLRFADKPHRSRRTVPTRGASINPQSTTEVSIRLEADELRQLMTERLPVFYVPAQSGKAATEEALFRQVTSDGVTIGADYGAGGVVLSATLSSYGQRTNVDFLKFRFDRPTGEITCDSVLWAATSGDGPEFATFLAQVFVERLYAFGAVRFGIDENPIGTNTVLQPDAGNLVQVLDLLSRNPARWRKYFESVKTVLPEVEAITFVPTENNTTRALIWDIDTETERDDLAVSLSECGTGVGQVLAMLYVVFTSEHPRTIIIDEPQSFLHPGAVRKLFEILKSYPQHQYVVTTHSPNAVTAADPNALFLVRKKGEESVVEQLKVSEARDQSRFLREVGSSLSDVFGADNILWVEGPTEEECFPLILSEVAGHGLLGTKLLGVVHTGDFESKHASTILEIYRRLSEGGGLLPPAIGFLFDREGRSNRERTELEHQSDCKVAFTERKMFENYLLDPAAIAYVCTAISGFKEDGTVCPEEVAAWIEDHGREPRYLDKGVAAQAPLTDNATWLTEVDGAKLLKDLFSDLSDARVAYDKVDHGSLLTRWLCANRPENLRGIADAIEGRLDRTAS